jgi:hypothetical protein
MQQLAIKHYILSFVFAMVATPSIHAMEMTREDDLMMFVGKINVVADKLLAPKADVALSSDLKNHWMVLDIEDFAFALTKLNNKIGTYEKLFQNDIGMALTILADKARKWAKRFLNPAKTSNGYAERVNCAIETTKQQAFTLGLLAQCITSAEKQRQAVEHRFCNKIQDLELQLEEAVSILTVLCADLKYKGAWPEK